MITKILVGGMQGVRAREGEVIAEAENDED